MNLCIVYTLSMFMFRFSLKCVQPSTRNRKKTEAYILENLNAKFVGENWKKNQEFGQKSGQTPVNEQC